VIPFVIPFLSNRTGCNNYGREYTNDLEDEKKGCLPKPFNFYEKALVWLFCIGRYGYIVIGHDKKHDEFIKI
jgi:hypothetical protein